LDILTMQLPINVKSPNNISKWHMEFNSAFKGLNEFIFKFSMTYFHLSTVITDSHKEYRAADIYVKLYHCSFSSLPQVPVQRTIG
jgi:hypothetical protein